MDSKDFKKIIEKKLKETFSNIQSAYCAKQRTSRPRVERDILREPSGAETSNCVTNDCTHDWGGDENQR